jgi:formyltetrahydrofolate deformylase
MDYPMTSAILLISCPDQPGLVAKVTDYVFRHAGNILDLHQHVDGQKGIFFMRVEWDLEAFDIPRDEITATFQPLADEHSMTWRLHFSDQTLRMGLFVSKHSHCLYDLLARWQSGEFNVEIPLIISNHPDMGSAAEAFGIPYYHLPVNKANKAEQEARQLELLSEHNVDFVVLARYMQILSGGFVSQYPNRVINIHHSFLPAFPGAKPYQQAYNRGVKIIGATSHYVTAELDAGPIIEQDVARADHRDSVKDLIRKGRDLEKTVLARAVYHHLQHRILVYGNKTVVFS